MPRFIQYIDHICDTKQRDVLWLRFVPKNTRRRFPFPDGRNCPSRAAVIAFLLAEGIPFEECLPTRNACEGLIEGYFGDLYIDLPYNPADPTYLKLERFLEDESGCVKLPDTKFYRLAYQPPKP